MQYKKYFDISRSEVELLKIIMRKNRVEIIHTGSFALYGIKNYDARHQHYTTIRINDIDIDLNRKLIESFEFLNFNPIIDAKIKLKLVKEMENYIRGLFARDLRQYDINKYKVIIDTDNIGYRKFNTNTVGFAFKVLIEKENQKDTVKFDINLERKQFKTESHKFVLDNEEFTATTYAYDKILADKYIATTKRLGFIVDDLKINNELNYNNLANFKKVFKDLYDINFILKVGSTTIDGVKENIKIMRNGFDWNNIKNIDSLINKMINDNPYIFVNRNNENLGDLSKLLNLIKDMFVLK